MTEPAATRVAVYLDFDNIVMSRYDQVHGRNSFQRDKARGFDKQPERLATATVDVGAIIDFASSFGTLVLTKAYADWSADVNAQSIWCSCFRPRRTAKTVRISGSRWMRSKTCSGCPT
jgi:hypothetical protein